MKQVLAPLYIHFSGLMDRNRDSWKHGPTITAGVENNIPDQNHFCGDNKAYSLVICLLSGANDNYLT